jgi:hypothetical protein
MRAGPCSIRGIGVFEVTVVARAIRLIVELTAIVTCSIELFRLIDLGARAHAAL